VVRRLDSSGYWVRLGKAQIEHILVWFHSPTPDTRTDLPVRRLVPGSDNAPQGGISRLTTLLDWHKPRWTDPVCRSFRVEHGQL
jgi:hypothetical protein